MVVVPGRCLDGLICGHAGARITWIAFALSSALQAALIFALGDDDAYGVRSSFPYGPGGVREPLVNEEVGLRAPLSSTV